MTELTDKEQEKLDKKLYDACIFGSLLKVKRLLAKGANLDQHIIEMTAFTHHFHILKYFIEQGEDINKFWCVLCFPNSNRQMVVERQEMVEYLISKGADLKLITDTKFVYEVDFEFLKNLIEKGYKLPKEDKQDLALRACYDGDIEALKYLVKKGFRVTFADSEALAIASKNDDLEMVKYLVDKGADVTAFDNAAMSCALRFRDFELIKTLVEKGADVNTEITNCSKSGHTDIVKYLLEKGADANTNFKFFCRNGDLEMVQYLHQNGAKINSYCEAIIGAAGQGHLEVVKYLHQNGADLCIDKNYVLVHSAANKQLAVVKYLIEQGMDIHTDDDSAIKSASRNGCLDMVKYLVEQGADINNVGKYGDTAIGDASKAGRLEVVKYLHQKGADLDKALENVNNSIKEELIAYKTSFDEKSLFEDDLKDMVFANKKTDPLRV
jgi:ankyrin repeat protein